MWGPLAVRRMPFRSSAARAAPLPYLVERMMRGMKLTRIFEGTNRMSALGLPAQLRGLFDYVVDAQQKRIGSF